jgi:hypothetical protein
MSNNTFTKVTAARFIVAAVKDGWTREVSHSQLSGGQYPRYASMVVLSRTIEAGANGSLRSWANIYISFRYSYKDGLRRVKSVSVSTIADYSKDSKKGSWNAGYEIRRLRDTLARWTEAGYNPKSQ